MLKKKQKKALLLQPLALIHKTGVIAEVNCETDFVARGDDFSGFANKVAEIALSEKPADLDALRALAYDGSDSVQDALCSPSQAALVKK